MTHTEKIVYKSTFIDPELRRKTVEEIVDTQKIYENGEKKETIDRRAKQSNLDSPEHKGIRARIRDSTEKIMGQFRKFTTKDEEDVGELESFDHPELVVSAEKHNTTTGDKKPDKLFVEQCLERHNEYRRLHDVPPLKWSNECYLSAMKWARHLATTGILESSLAVHRDEAIAMKRSTHGEPVGFAAYEAVDGFYAESKNYDYVNHTALNPKKSISHFTQMIWAGTTKVGMARAMALNGTAFIVAHYMPVGNIRGQYQENVLRPSE